MYKRLAVPMVTVASVQAVGCSHGNRVSAWQCGEFISQFGWVLSNIAGELYRSVYSERRVCHCYGEKCIQLTKLDLLVDY